ncbi:MAG TPA: hypothetical protein VMB85_03120 [Bryobacteraceae bacterium]|nr:hypothetical protein [Bryobacteraceae bacterium]
MQTTLQPNDKDNENRRSGFRQTLRRQFRELVKHLTGRGPEPRPKPRRRREGEAGRGFKAAAKQILRRIASLPPFYLMRPAWDTFTWLRIWDANNPAAGLCENSVESTQEYASDLLPRL